MKNTSIDALRQTLRESNRIVIIPHVNPDGDAMGSTLALKLALEHSGKQVHLITADPAPYFLDFLPHIDQTICYKHTPEQARQVIADADLFFCLDFGHLQRTDTLEPYVRKNQAPKCIIDHHPQPEDGHFFYFHDVQASSTCELVFLFLKELWPHFKPTTDIASCLYTGLVTDTGCFRFALRPTTFKLAAELLETGLPYNQIISHIFDVNTPARLALLGKVLNERLVILDQYHTVYMWLDANDLAHPDYKKGDTEGFVNYALSIKGTKMGVFMHPGDDGIIKFSFRSKGNVSVNEIAAAHFYGGGHKNAAGGKFKGTIQEAIARFEAILPEYKSMLTQTT